MAASNSPLQVDIRIYENELIQIINLPFAKNNERNNQLNEALAAECIKVLLSKYRAQNLKIDDFLNTCNAKGQSYLQVAILNGQTAVALLLIAAGADIELKDKIGKTALDYALEEKKIIVVRMLLQKNVSISAEQIKILTNFLSTQIQSHPDVILCHLTLCDRMKQQELSVQNQPYLAARPLSPLCLSYSTHALPEDENEIIHPWTALPHHVTTPALNQAQQILYPSKPSKNKVNKIFIFKNVNPLPQENEEKAQIPGCNIEDEKIDTDYNYLDEFLINEEAEARKKEELESNCCFCFK